MSINIIVPLGLIFIVISHNYADVIRTQAERLKEPIPASNGTAPAAADNANDSFRRGSIPGRSLIENDSSEASQIYNQVSDNCAPNDNCAGQLKDFGSDLRELLRKFAEIIERVLWNRNMYPPENTYDP